MQYRTSIRKHLKPKSREISFAHNLFRSYPIVSKFYQDYDSATAVHCEIFKTSELLKCILWTNEFSRGLRLKWVSDRYPILHKPHGVRRHTTTWWRHQMETFSESQAICAGNSTVTGEFPVQRPVTRSFDVFFDLFLNKRLSKQSWCWWFGTLSCPLWRHCNEVSRGPDVW